MKLLPILYISVLGVVSGSWGQVSMRYNQLGFSPQGAKWIAVAKARGDSIYVYGAHGVKTGTYPLGPSQFWDASQDSVRLVDLSGITAEGTYSLSLPQSPKSFSLEIKKNPYRTLTDGTLKFFYYQRSGMALLPEFAGAWSREAGHPDTQVKMHPSSLDSGFKSSSKGWYDAGDYGKYMVNSGISVYTLLSLYGKYPERFRSRNLGIPESNNDIPDILDEVRWNLDWMLTMQAKDGGVYHKLTTLRFPGEITPAADTSTRYIIGKTTTATFDFAASLARASLVYRPFDAEFADRCLQAARRAYAWGMANPDVKYNQPSDVQTGQYGDQNTMDERFWASVEMHLATGGKEPEFMRNAYAAQAIAGVADWSRVGMLGYFTVALNPKIFGQFANRAKDNVLRVADELRSEAKANGYRVSIASGEFGWGSNAEVANQGVVLLHAFDLTQDSSYRQTAQNNLDYLLGRNPLGISFVTGFGTKSTMDPHHRPSQSDSVKAPVPGMLAGGPFDGGDDVYNPDKTNESWKCAEYRVKNAPAKSYTDNHCSYATNEVAINWNAPLAYMSGALEE